jgi:integrase
MPKPKNEPIKLTKAYIDKVRPPVGDYEHHWDATVKGYGLRVMPSGKRVFVAFGRIKGKQVSVTLGPYGELTEIEAREKARKVLQQMREGVDPRDERKKDEAAAVTLAQVCAEYVSRSGKLKQSSKDAIERHIVTTLALWKDKPLTSITEDACRQQYRRLLKGGLHNNRRQGSPGQANQAFAVLRALINYAGRRYRRADGTPLILHNPVDTLRDDWVQLQPRTSRIPDNKVGAVWSALQDWRENAYSRDGRTGIDLVMFLMLTGCRLNEAAQLTWDRVHIEDDPASSWWHLPDPKNHHPFWFPLSTSAVELLKNRERVEGSNFVFTTWSASGHIVSVRDLLMKVSKIAGVKITAHDLRRTMITIGAAHLGIDLHKIELLSGHLPKTVTARHYLETSRLQYLYPEIQRIADFIADQAAKANGANVVPLRA